jgi:hypothetical protein
VNVRVRGTPDTVFVGEQATYEVAVYISESLIRSRASRSPTFTPPDLPGTLSYEMPPYGDAPSVVTIDGHRFRPHVYQRAIFPLVSGTHVVPAATLDYSVPVSTGFFSRDETRSVNADSVVIVALDLPGEGRPADFAGAVGRLRVEHSLSSNNLRTGDPLTLRVRVIGMGNIKLAPRPALDVPWADVILASERVDVEVIGGKVGGTKEFEWVVTPRDTGTHLLPPIRYPFFDPATRRYSVAETRAESLQIRPGNIVVSAERADTAAPPLEPRREFRGEVGRGLHMHPAFLVAAAAAPLPALLAWGLVTMRRSREARKRRRAAGRSSGGDDEKSISGARRKFLSSVEQRLGLRPGVASDSDVFHLALLRAGVSRETAEQATLLSRAMDECVFGGSVVADDALSAKAGNCYRKIDAEAIRRPHRAVFPSVALVLVVVASSAQPGDVATRYGRAIQLYSVGAYAEAADSFLALSQRYPRSPDVWASLGVAAWQTGDTAAAVVSWHRAVRLDPAAADVRRYLSRVGRNPAWTGMWIPPVPPQAAAVPALALWILAWSLLALRIAGRNGIQRGAILTCGLLALVAGAGAWELHRRGTDTSVAIVARETTSRSLPNLESAPVARMNAAELVRMKDREREWVRVQLEGKVVGWVHSRDVVRIAIED